MQVHRWVIVYMYISLSPTRERQDDQQLSPTTIGSPTPWRVGVDVKRVAFDSLRCRHQSGAGTDNLQGCLQRLLRRLTTALQVLEQSICFRCH